MGSDIITHVIPNIMNDVVLGPNQLTEILL